MATRGPRRPAELPARSRSMTMTRWSNGAEGRRRGDSLWTLRSDGTGKKARTASAAASWWTDRTLGSGSKTVVPIHF